MNRIEAIQNLPENGHSRNHEYKKIFELVYKHGLNNILYDLVSICEELGKYHAEEFGDISKSNEYNMISTMLEDVRKETKLYL